MPSRSVVNRIETVEQGNQPRSRAGVQGLSPWLFHLGVGVNGAVVVYLGTRLSAALASPASIGGVMLMAWALCWLMALVTALSGARYLWDNRQFINTAK